MHISDGSMHRKPELALSGSTEPLGVGKATPSEVLLRPERASSLATVMTIHNQTPKPGWSFR